MAEANAISTYMTFLMVKTASDGDWAKVCPIKSYGDLGGDPETIDTTTLENSVRTSINGIQEADNVTFTCNYLAEDFSAAKALKGSLYDYAVWFGGTKDSETGEITPTGSNGKVSWVGEASAWITGGGVNEPVEFTISISVSSDLEYDDGSDATPADDDAEG